MYNPEVINKIENVANNDIKFNLNNTNTKFEDFNNNPKTFESPSKIHFGTGYGTNQTNYISNLKNANSAGNIFNSNNQEGALSGKKTNNFPLNSQNNHFSPNQNFDPITEIKEANFNNDLKNTNHLDKSTHKSTPALIKDKISNDNKKSVNKNSQAKFKGKAELRRSNSQTGKEILAKRIQSINLDNLNLGKDKEFSLIELRNNYLDKDGNFMPMKYIAFKIKLTENEYRLLIKEKAKMLNNN